MKSKLFKKIVAGAAALAIAAQFAFVLPASAADEIKNIYVKTTFADSDKSDWTVSSGEMSVEGGALKLTGGNSDTGASKTFTTTVSNPIVYYNFVWNSGVSNGREGGYTYFKIGDLELRTYGTASDNKTEFTVGGKTEKIPAPVSKQDFTVSVVADTLAGKLTYNVSWSATGSVEGKVDLTAGVSYTKMDIGYHKPGRISASESSIKSLSVKEQENKNTYRDVVFDVEGTKKTVKVLEGGKCEETDIPSNPLKLGGYKFTKWKDSDTNTEYTSEELLDLVITGANKKFVAQFEVDESMIEKMVDMKIKTHPVQQPELPVKNADGTDTTKEYPVELSITGELGNEITASDYPYPKGNLEVTWSIEGFDTIEGVSTGEPVVRPNGDLVYCDSYMNLSGFTGNATKGTITLASGIKNYFGKFKVSVKYGNDIIGYNTLTDEFPLIIMPENIKPDNRIYPAGGYPIDLNWYADGLVGYTISYCDLTKNANVPDTFISNWCTWDNRGTKVTTLEKDEETGDKYIRVTAGSGSSNATWAVQRIGNVGEQIYADFDVRFSGSGTGIEIKDTTGKKDDYTGTLTGSSSFSAIHTTPYTNGIGFNGSALSFGDAAVAGMASNKWFRVRISLDDSTQQLWYQVNDIEEDGSTGALLGKTEVQGYRGGTSKHFTSSDFTFAAGSAGTVDFKNMTIYKPDMTSFTVSAGDETIAIPKVDPTEVEGVTNLDPTKNVVKVSSTSRVIVNVENKTGENETAIAYFAGYDENGKLVKVKSAKAVIGADEKKDIYVSAPEGSAVKSTKLYVWDNNMMPMINPVSDITFAEDIEPATTTLAALMKDGEGNNLSGIVNWSLQTEYEGVSIAPDPENPEASAVLTVTDAAEAGDIVVVASNRGQNTTATIRLTGTADNLVFVEPVTSITIPFDETPAVTTYRAEVRTGAGEAIEGKAVTYAMYNSTNSEPLANTSAISFDPATAKLTVTSDAIGTVVYIRATSTNSNDEVIGKAQKITIHGLAFDFGASEEEGVEEGYTAVTPDTVYTDAKGYGLESGTGVTAGGSASSLNGDYLETATSMTFKAKVPRGKNYKVTIAYKGGLSVEKITSNVSGVIQTTNAVLTPSDINVAVIDDVLDLTVSNFVPETGAAISGQIASIAIEAKPEKIPGDKPTWFTYGDSTTNSSSGGKISWGNRVHLYTTKFSISNTAKSGSNPETFYNNGYMNGILLNIAPGDLVTFNGMGTNGGMGNFETVITALTQACRDRGAYVIMTYYTPDLLQPSKGFTADKIYSSSEHKFIGSLRNDGTYTKIATEKGYPLIPFGQLALDAMNDELDKVSTTDMAARDARAGELMSGANMLDHNHYGEELANIFAKKFAPPVEAAYDELVAADAE